MAWGCCRNLTANEIKSLVWSLFSNSLCLCAVDPRTGKKKKKLQVMRGSFPRAVSQKPPARCAALHLFSPSLTLASSSLSISCSSGRRQAPHNIGERQNTSTQFLSTDVFPNTCDRSYIFSGFLLRKVKVARKGNAALKTDECKALTKCLRHLEGRPSRGPCLFPRSVWTTCVAERKSQGNNAHQNIID